MTVRSMALSRLLLIIIGVVALMMCSCSTPGMAVADGQLHRGEYYDASRSYRKIYNSLKKKSDRQQRGEIAYKMGLCYSKLGMNGNAVRAFGNALRYNYPDTTLFLLLGQAQHAAGNYKEAIEAYRTYISSGASDSTIALNGIAGCLAAAELKATPTRYIVKNARIFNSRRADFSPMFHGKDNESLYFTTTNEGVTGDSRSDITGMKKGDIWMVRKNGQGKWMTPEPATGDINSVHDEGVISFSPDGHTMYITRARQEPNYGTGVEIYTSQRADARWSAPVKFEIAGDSTACYGHPAVSPDGQWLYFTSNRPGGYGGKDIWRINLLEKGGLPRNLGNGINTAGDEMFPYVKDDSLIYFSSNGHPGLGGLDIFQARLLPSGDWKVTNMGIPLNSSADDFGMTFANDGEYGYFSSNRGDSRGYDHIYSFELPDLSINISGHVTDLDEEPVKNAMIRIVGDDGTNRKTVARPDGSFTFPLQRGVNYVMLAGAGGYLNARQEFTADIAEENAEYNVDFILASITKPNVVDNIFYDFDKATLRPESCLALDSMAQVLRDNPGITIELASHTDRKGSDEYNIVLSQRRAKAVTDYLTKAGIDPQRLSPHGYGKARPKTVTKRLARLYPQFKEGATLDEEFISTLDEADKEIADQINRRTEFQVLSTNYNMY